MAEWFNFQALLKKAIPTRGIKKKAKKEKKEKVGVPTEKVIEKKLTDKGTYELKINYIPKGMWHKEIMAKIAQKDSKVETLEMPEAGVILEPGKPMLPIEGIFIALPPKAELVGIKVTNAQSIEYPGKIDIIPAPEPTRDKKGSKGDKGVEYDHSEPEYKRDAIYNKDEEFPGELFKLLSVNYIGSVRVAHLMMYPLQYKPKSKILLIYNLIELVAEYTPGISIAKKRGIKRGATLEAAPEEADEEKRAIFPRLQREFKKLILNLGALKDFGFELDGPVRRIVRPIDRGDLSNTSNKGHYLVIITKDLKEAIKPLVESKESKGWSTKIVIDEEIYAEFKDASEPEYKAIRDFILYAYDNWDDPPEYVLLVGEVIHIPTHFNETYSCPSDWYYSNLIGDIGPDITIGRLAITDPKDLKHYVEKVLEYEKTNGTWTKRVLLTAYERQDYMNCSDDVANILKKKRNLKIIKKYGGQSTKKEVMEEIDIGCGIINYRGHGSEWEWQSSNGLDVNDVRKLENKKKWPVVFSICCLNNAIDVREECFGEAFIEAPEGCVAFLGASRPSYTAPNHHFNQYIFRAIVDHNLRVVGKIFNWATITLYKNFPDVYSQENISMYLLLGDPALEIKFPK